MEQAKANQEYNTAAIRRLLKRTFNDEDFDEFCYDFFHEHVYENFANGLSRSTKINMLIDHCNRHGLFEGLLYLVRKCNPHQFEAISPILYEKPLVQMKPKSNIGTIKLAKLGESVAFDFGDLKLTIECDKSKLDNRDIELEIRITYSENVSHPENISQDQITVERLHNKPTPGIFLPHLRDGYDFDMPPDFVKKEEV